MTQGNLLHTLAVRNPETGEAVALLAGSEVPEWASGLVHADDVEAAKPNKKAAAKRSSK